MAEIVDGKQVFSLYEVARSIQKTLAKRYTQSYWVKAELNKLNYYQHSGHCYPELVEKVDNKVVAQMRSILWKNDYIRINHAFKQLVNEPLKDGIKILMLASIHFDPKYGLSLQIRDIDPGYTLGDLEKEKQESIQKLKKEGIFHRNKSLAFPLLPQRIAVISVETSKGYADFLNVLEEAHRQKGYQFFQMLFPSLLQGEQAVKDMIGQLHQIKKVIHHFDIVVIVRGGGGDIGLSCYNHYDLAKEIAEFPIPVLTGIGHSTNETVAEMVAHQKTITPTGLAELLIRYFDDFAIPVEEGRRRIIEKTQELLAKEKANLLNEIRHFKTSSQYLISQNKSSLKEFTSALNGFYRFGFKNEKERLERLKQRIQRDSQRIYLNQKQELAEMASRIPKISGRLVKEKQMELNYLAEDLRSVSVRNIEDENRNLTALIRNIELLSPKNVLKRGYSISLLNSKAVTDAGELIPGDEIEIMVYKGKFSAKVESINKEEDE